MRKRYRRKHRSCSLCKPGKTGHSKRWHPREEDRLKRFESALQDGNWDRL